MNTGSSRFLLVNNITRELGESEEETLRSACSIAGVPTSAVIGHEVVRRAVDARGRRAPRFVLSLELELPSDVEVEEHPGGRVRWARRIDRKLERVPNQPEKRPVVVGMGPCGLFAAYQLAMRGIPPIIIDRGKPVETRAKDVAGLMGRGEINPDSNLCFGEGGAGTWSDGKLYTRVGGPWIRPILETLVAMGGPERILVDSRPHLGTDKLVKVLKGMRSALTELGCDLRFETTVKRLHTDGERTRGVELIDGTVIESDHVIFAPGHSARDLYRELVDQSVAMEPKPFAVGFRIEHPQALIDDVQYGRWAGHKELPAAIYELSESRSDRSGDPSVFSFCMCPGGSVVPTPTRHGEICVNGMSHAARSGKYANSAIVASIRTEDFERLAPGAVEGPAVLAGMRAQEAIEAAAWRAGGGEFVAPASTLTDFMMDRESAEVRRTTYKRGVRPANLGQLYPDFVIEALKRSVRTFDRTMRGFITEDAVLIGVETRTSAPIRMLRDDATYQSRSHPGLYPGGEGCGYGGGIMSAAIDGIRIAETISASLMEK